MECKSLWVVESVLRGPKSWAICAATMLFSSLWLSSAAASAGATSARLHFTDETALNATLDGQGTSDLTLGIVNESATKVTVTFGAQVIDDSGTNHGAD